jgi:hypothetical protein
MDLAGGCLSHAFGSDAGRWLRRLNVGGPLIVADVTDPARALERAVLARMEHGPQAIAVFIDEPRAVVAATLSTSILQQQAHIDVRRALLDQLAAGTLSVGEGRTSGALTPYRPEALTTLRHLYDLADTIVVRSWAERERLRQMFGSGRPSAWRTAPPDPDVPAPDFSASIRRNAIVIWAPKRTAEQVAFLAFAFHEMDMPVIAIYESGEPLPLGDVRFVEAGTRDAVTSLRSALVIVDAEFSDPGVAVALAAHGVPLAVTSCSGASEYLDPAYVYDPWNWRSVHRAGTTALGGPAPRMRAQESTARLVVHEPAIPSPAPLVSVVIPTYNRREILARTLRLWSSQGYPNYEIILVNDGGVAIDDIAAAHPRVRLINAEENRGSAAAIHRGVAEAAGEYLILTADDDEYAPDHLAQLVSALERTSANVGHTNIIIRHERGSAATARVTGYSLLWNQSMDRSLVLTEGILCLQGMMLRRQAYGEPCWLDQALPTGRDYGMILELALRHDFIHVDTSSAMYSIRAEGESSMRRDLRSKEAQALRMIYARHPTPDRPSIAETRERNVAFNERAGSDQFLEPAMRLRD